LLLAGQGTFSVDHVLQYRFEPKPAIIAKVQKQIVKLEIVIDLNYAPIRRGCVIKTIDL
jgi:hypothetical protein